MTTAIHRSRRMPSWLPLPRTFTPSSTPYSPASAHASYHANRNVTHQLLFDDGNWPCLYTVRIANYGGTTSLMNLYHLLFCNALLERKIMASVCWMPYFLYFLFIWWGLYQIMVIKGSEDFTVVFNGDVHTVSNTVFFKSYKKTGLKLYIIYRAYRYTYTAL